MVIWITDVMMTEEQPNQHIERSLPYLVLAHPIWVILEWLSLTVRTAAVTISYLASVIVYALNYDRCKNVRRVTLTSDIIMFRNP
jgi:isoprenylcysteine carboxyl methyltransferase (ICMT) family protein YpbQ